MARASKFSPEVRERAVRMVVEHAEQHESQWAANRSIAGKLGCAVPAEFEKKFHASPAATADEAALT